MTTRHHGTSFYEDDSGTRPITAIDTSIVGFIGTAPDADAEKFPYHQPVLLTSIQDFAAIGATGTAPKALWAMYLQGKMYCVFIRVPEPTENDLSNVIGGSDADSGDYEGIFALKNPELGLQPKILVAPGLSHLKPVADALINVADAHLGFVYADGVDTNDADVIAQRGEYGSKRIRIHDPSLKTTFNGVATSTPISAFIAGARSVLDNSKGSHWSLSNVELKGVEGTSRPVDYSMSDPSSRANLLNNNEVATCIRQDRGGYYAWGNRGCSSDPKYAFESVVRETDATVESIRRGIQWAVDRPINSTFFENVVGSVNNYLRYRKSSRAILGGESWADTDRNANDRMENGEVYYKFDLTVPAPAEHIGVGYQHVNDYYSDVIPAALLGKQ